MLGLKINPFTVKDRKKSAIRTTEMSRRQKNKSQAPGKIFHFDEADATVRQ